MDQGRAGAARFRRRRHPAAAGCRYPNNTLLRLITPQSLCRKLDIFPVKLAQEAISVDVSGAALTASTLAGRGGADTSIDLNNVFAEETRQYYEGQDPESESARPGASQAKLSHLQNQPVLAFSGANLPA